MIIAGVIGWPIKHSLSPHLHGWWLRHYGIAGEYKAYPVEPENLSAFITSLSANGFKGVNVTVPHKQAVIPYLNELSETAQRMGAVNTIVVRDDGTLYGDNTDGRGFMASLQEEAPEFDAAKPVVILGAGGAARAVINALHEAGARNIQLVNRTRENAAQLAQDLKLALPLYTWEQAPELLSTAGLIVNTSILGMKGQPPLSLPLDNLSPSAIVFDLIYNPLQTQLLASAKSRGNKAINGLGMLLHQAAPGFAYWFGRTPHVMPEQRFILEAEIS